MELDGGFYMGGKYRKPEGNEFEIKNPYDGSIVAVIHMACEKEREEALNLACESFENVSGLKPIERIEMLEGLRDGMSERSTEIAEAISIESGKPIKYAKVEVGRAFKTLDLAIETIKDPDWEHIPMDLYEKGDRWRYGIIQRFPIGVVLGITPFNFPLNLVMHKLAPAIAAGCPFILKPASQVSSTALILGEILHDKGVLPGQVTIIPMTGKTADGFIGDDRIKLITFTGSPEVGWDIQARSKKTRVSLELGGNAGCVVEPDSDIDWAVERLLIGAFANQGQVCISTQRVYVQKDIYENLVDRFVARTKKLKMGNPLDSDTDIGPMITLGDAERVKKWVDEAVESGAKLRCGGNHDGNMFEPTVLENSPDTCSVMKDEIFGPVVNFVQYSDFNEALNAVSNTRYGLQAGIFTRDMEKAYSAFRKWQVGGVMINDVPTFRVDAMPYGGSRESGTGREGPKYAIEEMTERRIMVVNRP